MLHYRNVAIFIDREIYSTTNTYCDALLHNLENHALEPEVLFAFRIFDSRELPLYAPQRQRSGNQAPQALITRFPVVSKELCASAPVA